MKTAFFFLKNGNNEKGAKTAFDSPFSIKLDHTIKLLSFTFSRMILVMI